MSALDVFQYESSGSQLVSIVTPSARFGRGSHASTMIIMQVADAEELVVNLTAAIATAKAKAAKPVEPTPAEQPISA